MDFDADGFVILPNGNFLMNSGDANPVYHQYSSVTGAELGLPAITVPGAGESTGVDTDGSILVFHTDFNGFTITDLNGNLIRHISDGGDVIEDISLSGVHNLVTIPEPASLALLGLGVPALAMWLRRRSKRVTQ